MQSAVLLVTTLNGPVLLMVFSAVLLAASPVQAQFHVYWGDMHGHTASSDGKGTLDDYFTYARDVAKLDFVVVSDHDFGNAAPWHMPKETWTLTQDKVDQYTTEGKFIAAKIGLDFKINGHCMGEEIEIDGQPRIVVDVRGTAAIEEVVVVRDGSVVRSLQPGATNAQVDYVDEAFGGNSYYYVRVIQADKDEHGNRSHAWSSPIWVRKK